MTRLLLVLILLCPSLSWGTSYYISPTGSNSNAGTSEAAPWLTFSFAIDASRAWCGDVLLLLDGTYGDGTSTGKPSLSSVSCGLGNEFAILSLNDRQAKINDNGCGRGINVANSSYIIIQGIYVRSVDNNTTGCADPGDGEPIRITSSHHVTVRGNVVRNPNRYANSHLFDITYSNNVLLEDNEGYVFHRHCVLLWQSSEIVVRRPYCNPRGGRIPGGFGLDQGPVGSGSAVVSMYPCKDCVIENAIADGTTHSLYLTEMNSTYGSLVLMSGAKVYGSICYKCNYGNGIYPNARTAADLNHTPQNITVRDVAIVDYGGTANGVRCSDCVNALFDHLTILSLGTGANGIVGDNTSFGATSAQASMSITNSLVAGFTTGAGYRISGYDTRSGDRLYSVGNGTAFSPALPDNWTNTSTAAHGMGTCKLWVPAGSPLKGAGTGGSDIGATILYRTVNGVLTTTPLWDPDTGEFPHGATDPDGTNAVTGQSLFDIHERLNVNRNGCPFPAGYGGGAGPVVDPVTRVTSTNVTGPHIVNVDVGMKSLTVGVMAWHAGSNVGYATGVQSSCGGGEPIPALAAQTLTSPAWRSVRTFGLINPSAGTCTITPTMTGNVDGWVMISVEDNNTSGYGTITVANGLSSTPSATGIGNPDYQFLDFLATSSASTISPGAWQTLAAEVSHPSQSLRGASSSQRALDDSIMSYTLGVAPYWAMQVVPLIPAAPGGGTGEVLTQTHYGIFAGYGSESGSEPLADTDRSAIVAANGMFRVRFEIQGSVAETAPFGVALYCRKNAEAFSRVMDTFGSTVFRFFGAGTELERPRVPASLTPTTQRLQDPPTLDFVPGAFLRDQASVFVVPALQVGQRTELSFAVVLNAAENDVINCRVQKDDGSALSVYGQVSGVVVGPSRELRGF